MSCRVGGRPSSSVLFLFACLCVLWHLARSLIPDADFHLDVNGISISVEMDYACVIEEKLGEDIGGRVGCYGFADESGRMDPPEDNIFVQVVTGQYYGCGINLDQTVTCWGKMASPEGLFVQLTGEDFYICGIMADASIRCWGSVPHLDLIPGGSEDASGKKMSFVQVSCGGSHCCAIDSQAVPHCWGKEHDSCPFLYPPTIASSKTNTSSGEEEDDEEDDAYADEEDEELGRMKGDRVKVQFAQVAAASAWSCGITLEKQDLHCWGHRKHHLQEPDGYPPKFAEGPFKQVAVGGLGVCALHETADHGSESPNKLQCWGSAGGAVPDLQYDQISVGSLLACAVDMDSEVHCWGRVPASVLRLPKDLVVA